MSLHKNVLNICKSINEAFSVHLLLWIGVTFVLFVGDLYILVHMLLFKVFLNVIGVAVVLKTLIGYIIDLHLLFKSTIDLCYEANKTKKSL